MFSKTDKIIATVAIILIFIIIPFGVYTLDKKACMLKGQSFDDVQYTFVAGCMVKHNDRWLPLENIRGFGDE